MCKNFSITVWVNKKFALISPDKAVRSRQCEISKEDSGWAGESSGSGGDRAAEKSWGDTR